MTFCPPNQKCGVGAADSLHRHLVWRNSEIIYNKRIQQGEEKKNRGNWGEGATIESVRPMLAVRKKTRQSVVSASQRVDGWEQLRLLTRSRGQPRELPACGPFTRVKSRQPSVGATNPTHIRLRSGQLPQPGPWLSGLRHQGPTSGFAGTAVSPSGSPPTAAFPDVALAQAFRCGRMQTACDLLRDDIHRLGAIPKTDRQDKPQPGTYMHTVEVPPNVKETWLMDVEIRLFTFPHLVKQRDPIRPFRTQSA